MSWGPELLHHKIQVRKTGEARIALGFAYAAQHRADPANPVRKTSQEPRASLHPSSTREAQITDQLSGGKHRTSSCFFKDRQLLGQSSHQIVPASRLTLPALWVGSEMPWCASHTNRSGICRNGRDPAEGLLQTPGGLEGNRWGRIQQRCSSSSAHRDQTMQPIYSCHAQVAYSWL